VSMIHSCRRRIIERMSLFPYVKYQRFKCLFGDGLMTTRAWHHFLACTDVLPENTILRAPEDVGVSPYPLDLDVPSSPGMLVFDKITPQLCDLLREVSHNGLQRVLAIALSLSALVDNGAWRLLQAGASDVFSWDHSDSPVHWKSTEAPWPNPSPRPRRKGSPSPRCWIGLFRPCIRSDRLRGRRFLTLAAYDRGRAPCPPSQMSL
jgi:hypothetical protein